MYVVCVHVCCAYVSACVCVCACVLCTCVYMCVCDVCTLCAMCTCVYVCMVSCVHLCACVCVCVVRVPYVLCVHVCVRCVSSGCLPSVPSSAPAPYGRTDRVSRAATPWGAGCRRLTQVSSQVRMASSLSPASSGPRFSLNPLASTGCLRRAAQGQARARRCAPHPSPCHRQANWRLRSPSEGKTTKPTPV